VGKTRLALEVLARYADAFPDGAWFVDLSALRDPSLVPGTIATTLGLGAAGPDAVGEQLSAYLQTRDTLVILDNAEQVLTAAPLLDDLLAAAPGLRILVTSREALHLRAEQTLPVSPLALPDPIHLPALEQLAEVPSVALFVQRAQMMNPGFRLTNKNARAIAELVVHLDGLPLAIELAAARTPLLSPQMLLDRLGERLSLLRWEAQDAPERQQTLRAAIAWSYDLLAPEEQLLFRSLAVFVGGFTLEAAAALATSIVASSAKEQTFDMVGHVASLVDETLLERQDDGMGGYRFRFLESVREFAVGQMLTHGEEEAVGRAHALYFLDLSERAASELAGPQQRQWFLGLQLDHGDLRTALAWLGAHGEPELALRMATALSSFWEAGGYIAEGRRQLEAALERAAEADPRLRARALSGLGSLLVWIGWTDTEAGRSAVVLNEALELARSVGDSESIARSLRNLGIMARHTGDLEQGRRYLEEALTYSERSGNISGAANVLLNLGVIELLLRHHREASRFLEASVARSHEIGDVSSRGLALTWLVFAGGELGDVPRAVARLRELLVLINEVHNRRLLYLCGIGAAWVLRERADAEQLGKLLGAIQQLQEMMGVQLGRFFYASTALSSTNEALVHRLGEESFQAALAEGRHLTFEQTAGTVSAVLDSAEEPAGAETRAASVLSPRERDVLGLVAQGLSNKQIGKRLFVSEGTVKTHVTSVFNKLGVETRAQAVAVAASKGLLGSSPKR